MARSPCGILLLLAGFTLLINPAKQDRSSPGKNLVTKHAEPGQETDDARFNDVSAHQELNGKG